MRHECSAHETDLTDEGIEKRRDAHANRVQEKRLTREVSYETQFSDPKLGVEVQRP